MFYNAGSGGRSTEDFMPIRTDVDRYSALNALLSPLRKHSVWELWSPLELAVFETGLSTVGKDFHAIAKLVRLSVQISL